jgi:hypothetical protein
MERGVELVDLRKMVQGMKQEAIQSLDVVVVHQSNNL